MKNLILLAILITFSSQSKIFNLKNGSIEIKIADITEENVDVIVNAANEKLKGGSGVCGSIFNKAGWQELQDACDKHIGCKVGSAKITDSFNLKANGVKKIIHAVGPDCRIVKDGQEQEKLLYSAYYKSLKLTSKNNLNSIAFPFISSGIYQFPKERAAKIALRAAKDYLKKESNLKKIKFILFSDEDYKIFEKSL